MGTFIKSANPSDQYVLAILRERQENGFELLYRKYWNDLICVADNYVHNREASKELVQELFTQLYAKGSRLTVQTSLKFYLHKALRNRIVNYFRDEAIYKKHINKAVRTEEAGLNSAITTLDLTDMEKKIRQSLSMMSENCRIVFVLNREKHLTIKQIAVQLRKPEDTIEKQLRRAISFLKKHLAAHLNGGKIIHDK